jgi:hypothetical protein
MFASVRVTDSRLRNHTRQVEERLQIEDDLQARHCTCPIGSAPCCSGRIWLQRTHGFASVGAHFQPPGLASSWTGSDVVFDENLSTAPSQRAAHRPVAAQHDRAALQRAECC